MTTKKIFKMFAFAMLMPTMLLTTSCSSDDDFVNTSENTEKKGYALPVTVNVTRQGDATTRANYNESTRKLEFSAGDKLFVEGNESVAGNFSGTLDMVSEGTFSGTITTNNPYSGTADELFTAAGLVLAHLLPAGYEEYNYFIISHFEDESWNDWIDGNVANAFASSKKLGVEQLSWEYAESYSGGFALTPHNAILNFTITGLKPSTNVTATLAKSGTDMISGQVTTDGSGTATFAMAIRGDGNNIKDISLTVGGKAITLTDDSKKLEAGHIYNITRSVAPAWSTLTIGDATIYYVEGETWIQAISIHSTENTGWNFIPTDRVFYGHKTLLYSSTLNHIYPEEKIDKSEGYLFY